MPKTGPERRVKKRYGVKNSTLRYRRMGVLSVLRAPSPKYLLLNLSESGCHFITRELLSVGDALSLTIDAEKMAAPFRARGEVVWCRKSEELNAHRIGVRFTSIRGKSRTLLKHLLDGAILENIEVSTRIYLKEIERL